MKKILVIDDDVDFNHILRDLLEFNHYQVSCAYSGQQGLELLKDEMPDLIITDVLMPEVDGIMLLGQLKGREEQFPCKVMVISGGGSIDSNRCLKVARIHGVDATLGKPFTLWELEQTVSSLLA